MKGKKVLLWVLLALTGAYCLLAFAPFAPFAQLRSSYIQTAMSTLNHRWLATAFFPPSVIDGVMADLEQARQEQLGVPSTWEPASDPGYGTGKEGFFRMFPQLQREEVERYVETHPEAVAQGWENFYVNQSGPQDEGLPLTTQAGDRVLAIDAANGILILRIRQGIFQGVLAIGCDPSRLALVPAPDGTNYLGEIAQANGALLAITASGFQETDDSLVGWAVYDGVLVEGKQAPWHKRLELRSDHRLYITDALSPLHSDTRYAMEFTPALLIDGVSMITDDSDFSDIHPRVCLGQDQEGRVLLLAIQGRSLESIGATGADCAQILLRYDCRQAMNLDGGNSAMLWYRGQYLLEGANSYPLGRKTVNAWIYTATQSR